MANEVVIEEYSGTGLQIGTDGKAVPIPGKFLTSQVLTIGAQSALLQKETAMIRIQSVGTGFWYLSGINPTAVSATSPSRFLPANQFRDLAVTEKLDLKISTIA